MKLFIISCLLPTLLVFLAVENVSGKMDKRSNWVQEHKELANDIANLAAESFSYINPFSYWTRKPTPRPQPTPTPAPQPPQPVPEPPAPAPQPEPQPQPEPPAPAPQPEPEPAPAPEGETAPEEGLEVDSEEIIKPHKLLNNKLDILGGKGKKLVVLPKDLVRRK